jgi:magnesium transporter
MTPAFLVDVGLQVCCHVVKSILCFGFHPLAVRACTERNHIPRVHAYTDHVFVVLRW